jgi:hypothetical protein
MTQQPNWPSLKVWLNSPGDQGAIRTLFAIQKGFADAYYEGAASMGVDGYRFRFTDAWARDAMRTAIHAALHATTHLGF